jgi:hypothetical protein
MGNPSFGYQLERPYAIPARRLLEKYGLNIKNYISRVTDMGRNEQEGFWFATSNSQKLIADLIATKAFIHDNRGDMFHAMAASATQGEGYREVSEKSIHFQISEGSVNMHVDHTGFIWRGPDGKVYIGPDAIYHILDELKWAEAVAWVYKKNKIAGMIMERLHPELPRTANRFDPKFGVRFDILRGNAVDFSKQWSLSLDFKWGCTDFSCNRTEMLTGLNFTYRHK